MAKLAKAAMTVILEQQNQEEEIVNERDWKHRAGSLASSTWFSGSSLELAGGVEFRRNCCSVGRLRSVTRHSIQ